MSKRVGSLLIFKPGVTKAQAEEALKALKNLVEPGFTWDRKGYKDLDGPAVNEYDDQYGSPSWYIP